MSRATPRTHAPLPTAFCARAVRVEPLGSRERYTCYLPRFNPSFAIASPPARPPNVWARSDLRGKKLKASRDDDLCGPGPGVWPLRPAERHCGGERMAAAPALEHFCHCAETSSSGLSARPAARSRDPPPAGRRTISYRPVRRRLRATDVKSGLHSPLSPGGSRPPQPGSVWPASRGSEE